MRYLIRFYGTPLGSLNTTRKVYIRREVEADTIEAARLDAYRTHEHTHGTILVSLKCDACSFLADPLQCGVCAGTGWTSSTRESLENVGKVIIV